MVTSPLNIFWFRRDLRLYDNAGLFQALKANTPVLSLFIFDTNILDELDDRNDRRVEFIHKALEALQKDLQKPGSTLIVRHGKPLDIFKNLTNTYTIAKVFTNHDYEPYARRRDSDIQSYLQTKGIEFESYKDQVLLEKNEVMKEDGKPYTVFTPYSKKWKEVFTDFHVTPYRNKKYFGNFYKAAPEPIPSLGSIGFSATGALFPANEWKGSIIRNYKDQRDFPAVEGTSRLSVHLRFGTISIRVLAGEAGALNDTFLNELIWRDFYQMILWHFPRVVTESFKPEYDKIPWRNNEVEFNAWCSGQTGYPIVDAGMRQLNATGFMHNRVRMITASFLVKHLLVDWRWGEAYFAKKLLDYDLAANNGGWQWAAGSGCDAAPYFRIFNPYIQAKKFDSENEYIRRWVPEFESPDYPPPIIQHELARERCLRAYKSALSES